MNFGRLCQSSLSGCYNILSLSKLIHGERAEKEEREMEVPVWKLCNSHKSDIVAAQLYKTTPRMSFSHKDLSEPVLFKRLGLIAGV